MLSKQCTVTDGRIRFVCACGTKRMIAVRSNERRRRVTCHKCGSKNECKFNRRSTPRTLQSGKALLDMGSGQRLAIDFFDISCSGVGFILAPGYARRLHVGQELQGIICEWNRFIVPRKKIRICNISGNKVGGKFV